MIDKCPQIFISLILGPISLPRTVLLYTRSIQCHVTPAAILLRVVESLAPGPVYRLFP